MARRKKKVSSSKKPRSLSKKEFVKVSHNEKFFKPHVEDFTFVVQRRTGKKGKYRYVSVSKKKFKKGSHYRIFIKHKRTGQRRLLGFGKFYTFPERSKFTKKLMGGRTFDPKPLPKSASGKWVPTWKIIRQVEEEVYSAGREQHVEVRGSIIPVKRWYHTEYKVYSDTIRKPSEKLKGVAVSVLLHYVYPNNQWIQKRTVVLDLRPRGIMIKNLVKYEEKIIDFVVTEMRFEHPTLNFRETNVLAVNGFVPLDYLH